MAIYRGPGGAGDATTDSSTEAAAALAAAAAALVSQNAAAASATAAANSASAASTSAGNAAADAGDAASSASQALDAQTAAETAQTGAETAQAAAEAAQLAAEDARDASLNFGDSLVVDATTLSAGSSATVAYDSLTTTISFGIPTGATGATGSTGATGATGAQGPQGDPGLVWQGDYASGTAYDVDDAVSYNGSSYICILASTGNTPTNTTYWNLLAAKGTDGGGGGSGTVTSVDVTVPTGLSVSGTPITTSGTAAITYASGYSLPTTTKQGQWDTAYSWGNHASAGYAHAGANTDITSMSSVTGGISTPDYITFDTTPETVPTAAGSLYWDSADGNQTLALIMAGGDVTQQIGQEQYYRIKASSAITNGQVVMFTGSVGASGALTGAPATGLTAATASYVMGIATQDIALNGWGYVTSFGLVRDVNTNAFTAGSILYLDPTVAGGLTATIPTAPAPKVQVCACVHQSSTVGSLFVRTTFGGTLGQYEGDVTISTPSSGQVLKYNGTTWVNTAETDPVYTASSWYSTTNNASNWDTAYGWGNHASAGYLTTSSAASTYLTQANAASTYQTQSGMSSYLTTSSAASTYFPIAGGAFTGGVKEKKVAIGASAIDVSAGNYFSKTLSGSTTFTVSNVPSTGTTASFILDLTNSGSYITWWSGMKWAGGTAPTLTTSGRDVLGFFTHDGGTTWTGLVLGKDVK